MSVQPHSLMRTLRVVRVCRCFSRPVRHAATITDYYYSAVVRHLMCASRSHALQWRTARQHTPQVRGMSVQRHSLTRTFRVVTVGAVRGLSQAMLIRGAPSKVKTGRWRLLIVWLSTVLLLARSAPLGHRQLASRRLRDSCASVWLVLDRTAHLTRRSPATGGARAAQRAARGGSVPPGGRKLRRVRLSVGGGHAAGHRGAAGAQPRAKARPVGAVE